MEININFDDSKLVPVGDEYFVSRYARLYDCTCIPWQNNASVNLEVLLYHQRMLSERLKTNGYLFLNDVYEMLGFAKTLEGQFIGWIYEPEKDDKDNCVSFMLHEAYNKDFHKGYTNDVILDFNVDGVILDKVFKEES